MLKKSCLIMASALTLSACVSMSKHEVLQQQYDALQASHQKQKLESLGLSAAKASVKEDLDKLQKEYDQLAVQKSELKTTYDALANRSSKQLVAQANKNQALLQNLQDKEMQLTLESARVNELKTLIRAKEAQMLALKQTISKALHNFEGQGLTVEQRRGKIYVSMENKLLFKSGSWAVGDSGKDAIQQLAAVLAQSAEVNVLIEGHTDNIPFTTGTDLIDNWDLSVKRATAIVRILEEKGVTPAQMTAAGRSEHLPVDLSDSKEGRAKNRRIEIILAPNLDEIAKLLTDEANEPAKAVPTAAPTKVAAKTEG